MAAISRHESIALQEIVHGLVTIIQKQFFSHMQVSSRKNIHKSVDEYLGFEVVFLRMAANIDDVFT